MSSTLVLNNSDVKALLDRTALLEELKSAFAAVVAQDPALRGLRHPIALPQSDSSAAGMVLGPGLIPGIPCYTVKVNAKFPDHPPAIKGVVVLHSLNDGSILALIDSGYLTAERTAAAGAVGADVLARENSESVAIIGCGVQGRAQLDWMARIRPVKRAFLHDISREVAMAFSDDATHRLGIETKLCGSAGDAARHADIVVTATWAAEPILFRGDVREGAHVTTLGADGPGECEIARDLLEVSNFFADDAGLQIEMGAIGGVGLGRNAISAEIGEVLAGHKPGRQSEREITVFGMVGLPVEDLAAAWLVYNAALESGAGARIDLLA